MIFACFRIPLFHYFLPISRCYHRSDIEGAKQHITGVRNTYPDLNLSIDLQIEEGEWIATCYTMKGTHTGSRMNIKPTGKRIEVTGVKIDKVIDNKIVEHGDSANMFEALLEIGAIKIVNETKE